MTALTIAIDDPARADVTALLNTHAAFALAESPPGTCHFLDVAGLKTADIQFWSARRDGALVGVAALKTLSPDHGEVKSMHVAETARGQGVAQALMAHLISVARDQRLTRLSLETGNSAGFQSALRLYARLGFVPCPPFGGYTATDFNVFMTLALEPAR